jgi:putative tryptophan/tyrosine transport system substrate-binding protein
MDRRRFCLDAFRQGLNELGWVEGRNIELEVRAAEEKHERLPTIAAELVRLRVDIIFAPNTPTVAAAKNVTTSIPIVMAAADDPVGRGFVGSLSRPGGNITGLTMQEQDILTKNLQYLKEVVPNASRVFVLQMRAATATELEEAATSLRIRLQVVTTRSREEFDDAFASMARGRADALLLVPTPLFLLHRARLVELAAKARLPAIYGAREYAEAGGLMAYGTNYVYNYRYAAVYVDRILKGAKTSDLPVEQPTKFELVINLKTAKALGLTIPPSLLARADQVIE